MSRSTKEILKETATFFQELGLLMEKFGFEIEAEGLGQGCNGEVLCIDNEHGTGLNWESPAKVTSKEIFEACESVKKNLEENH